MYLECDGENRGFAGNCLPKDLQAFASFVQSVRPEITLFESIAKDNKFYRD
jgi:UDP-glucose 6-dehydrogenase